MDSIYNILIFFAEKNVSSCKSNSHFFSKKFQCICVTLNVNFNISLTNNIVNFEQLGPVQLQTDQNKTVKGVMDTRFMLSEGAGV